MDSLDIGTIILSSDYRVVGMNSCAQKILKLDSSKMGKRVFDYHSPSSRRKIKYLIAKIQDNQQDLPVAMIIDVLNKVLMINFCKIHMVDQNTENLYSMSFIDVSDQTEAHINPENGVLNIRKFPIFHNGSIVFLDASSIYYIQSDGNYCKLITDHKSYYLHLTLKEILHRYSGTELMRVHKSFIVNLEHIREIRHISSTKNIIIFDRESIKSIPIAKRKMNDMKALLALHQNNKKSL